MENSQTYIAVISIIVSGIVAISSIIAPIIINQISERNKWKREIKRDRIKLISELTQKFLEELSGFRPGSYGYELTAKSENALNDLLSAYYKWECVVSENLAIYKERILKLRKVIEKKGISKDYLSEKLPSISNEILELSSIAKVNILL